MVNCRVCNKVIGFMGFANHVRKHKKELGEDIYVKLRTQRILKDKSKWHLIPRPSYKQLVLNELYPQNNTQDTPKPLESTHNSSYTQEVKAK